MATQMVPQFTPVGRRFVTFLGTYNSGDRNALREFIAAAYAPAALQRQPLDTRVLWHVAFFQQTGRLTVGRLNQISDYELEAFMKATQTGSEVVIKLRVDEDAPHLILEFSVR